MFHVGQEVICISDREWITQNGELVPGPKFMEKVTVDGIIQYSDYPGMEIVGLLLCEYRTDQQPGYWSIYFRPLEKLEKETDISVFNSVLENTKVEEPA